MTILSLLMIILGLILGVLLIKTVGFIARIIISLLILTAILIILLN